MKLGIAAALFANLVWGLAPLLVKSGVGATSELSFLLVRFAFSVILFLPIYRTSRKRFLQIPSGQAIALGVLLSSHFYLQMVALKSVPVSWYVLFFAAAPLLTVLIVERKFSFWTLTSGFAAAVGCALFADLSEVQPVSAAGIMALVLAVATWVGFTLMVKRLQNDLTDIEISAFTNLISFVSFLLLWLCTERSLVSLTLSSTSAAAVLSVLLPLAFIAFSFALRKVPTFAVLSQYSEPAFGVLGGVLLLHEILTRQQFVGMTLVAGAVGLVSLHRPRSSP